MIGTFDILSRARDGLRSASLIAAFGAAAALAAPADAALIGTLSFTVPTGVVGPSDPVDVYLTLTLDAASDALTTASDHTILSGVTDEDWVAAGIDPGEIGFTYLNVFFQCGGTFDAVCLSGPPYGFTFASDMIGAGDFDLQPGGSAQILFGTFTPNAGPVAPGTYTFYNAGITANALDRDGDPFLDEDDNQRSITLFQTCPSQEASCAFTRTVEDVESAVPEPATWAMMLSGFGAIGYSLRRRRISYMRQAV